LPRSPNWQSKQMQPNAINTALNRFSYVEDIILHIFYFVATNMPDLPRHSQAKLYPCELVTIGILFALKGGYFRAFYPCPNALACNACSKPIEIGVTCFWPIPRFSP